MTERANTPAMKMHNVELASEYEKLRLAVERQAYASLDSKNEMLDRMYFIEAERQKNVYVIQQMFDEDIPYDVVEIVSPSTFNVRKMKFDCDEETGEFNNFKSDEEAPVITIRRGKRTQSVFFEAKSNKFSTFTISKEPRGHRELHKDGTE